ncbi:MAG: M23 family metallopeptidase [Thermomicrobiales bacterium]
MTAIRQSHVSSRRVVAFVLLLALLVSPSAIVLTAAQEPPESDLTAAVQQTAAAATGTADAAAIVVSVIAESGDWAFGTAGAPAASEHDAPDGLLFLATRTGGGWDVAIRYTPAFDALLAQAPDDLLPADIRASLEGFQAAGDGSAQLSLPWDPGLTWRFGGPHPNGGSSVWSSLDFYPASGSGHVRAARGGIAYRPCANLVRIDHGGGLETNYYHLTSISVGNGQSVSRGTYLGYTSAGVGCGGYASGPHVHLWIEQNGQQVAIAGKDIGGWTVENGDAPYDGCMVKDGVRKCIDRGRGFYDDDIYNNGEFGSGPGNPSASISPTRGTVNTWVNYSINGFPGNATVLIEWRRTSGSHIDVGTVRTSGGGSASGRVRVPATPGGNDQRIRFSAGSARAYAYYDIAPRIKAIPGSASRGETIEISLRGFGKKETVRIRWERGNGWVELTRVVTSNTGSANLSVRVPSWAPDGINPIRGDGTSFRAQTNAFRVSGGFSASEASPAASPIASAPVEMTPTVEPTPTTEASPTPEATTTPEPSPTVEPTLPPEASPSAEVTPNA